MFLNSLSPTEKDNFMRLAVAVIKADGIIEESEKQILSAYADEMQIPVCNPEEQGNLDNVIKDFAEKSTLQTKRVVFVELLALAFADGSYVAEEKALMQQLANAFNFDKAFVERAVSLQDAYVAVYMSLVTLIEKGE